MSHDGKLIIFHRVEEGSARIMKVSIDGGTPQALTGLGGYIPVASRRENIIEYLVETPDNYPTFRVVKLEDGATGASVDLPSTAKAGTQTVRFKPDGKSLAFIDSRNERANL